MWCRQSLGLERTPGCGLQVVHSYLPLWSEMSTCKSFCNARLSTHSILSRNGYNIMKNISVTRRAFNSNREAFYKPPFAVPYMWAWTYSNMFLSMVYFLPETFLLQLPHTFRASVQYTFLLFQSIAIPSGLCSLPPARRTLSMQVGFC